MIQRMIVLLTVFLMAFSGPSKKADVGQTEIAKWQGGKKAAVSLTYDDSTINHFRVAIPLMNELGLPGTFYIVTGAIPGSEYKPKFVGRPVEEIIAETAEIPTNEENFFERASAIRFPGYEGTYQYHNRAHGFYSRGDLEGAYDVIDEGFQRIRNGEFEPSNGYLDELYNVLAIEDQDVDLITWPELQKFAEQGHEFGSHTILHPYLAVMDSTNIFYELEKSRLDILNHLGPEHTFSAECPFGTEDERVMEYAHQVFPALRNRMPRNYLTELNRSSDEDPRQGKTEYVQWQRGPLSDTPMDLMKSWVDQSLEEDNIWLVNVFHGVEGIGWEPLTRDELEEYFTYIKDREDQLWVATFKDVTKYMRERMNADVQTSTTSDEITVELTHSLDQDLYDFPLTLKTYLPSNWETIRIKQGNNIQNLTPKEDEGGTYVRYRAQPNGGSILLSH